MMSRFLAVVAIMGVIWFAVSRPEDHHPELARQVSGCYSAGGFLQGTTVEIQPDGTISGKDGTSAAKIVKIKDDVALLPEKRIFYDLGAPISSTSGPGSATIISCSAKI